MSRLLKLLDSPLCAPPVPAGISCATRPGRGGWRGHPLLAHACPCVKPIADDDTCLRCGHLLDLEGFGRAA